MGDALNALTCAAGYNIRWLLRAITYLGLAGFFCALSAVVLCIEWLLAATLAPTTALNGLQLSSWQRSPGFVSRRPAAAA